LLADLGADVVKVEPPHGDPLCWWGPFPGHLVDPDASGLFPALNTSKRNVHASLSESTGADTFLELVRGADLVVESLGPGTLERLELGPTVSRAARGCGWAAASPSRRSGRSQPRPRSSQRSRPATSAMQAVVDVSMLECLVGTLAYPLGPVATGPTPRDAARHRARS
jgi:CoA-transferase family III